MIIINFFIFVLACLFSFTAPGLFLLNKTKLELGLSEKIYLSTFLGFITFTIISYFLLILKIGILTAPIILIINILIIKSNFKLPISKSIFQSLTSNFSKKTAVILLVFILGLSGQLAIISPSGLIQNGDLIFYSAHGHDGPWHIALMEEIKKGFPLHNPIYAGEGLVNYHFFSDIAPSQFSKYLLLSNFDLYFRFFPLLFSILLGTSAYFLGKKMTGSWLVGLWATIFTYFAGSFGYIITLLQTRTIGGESLFWATQIQSSSGNPPQIISNIAVLTFFYLLISFIAKRNPALYLILIIIVGSLVSFKVYAAIVVFIALAVTSLWQLVKERKAHFFILIILSGVLSSIFYFPNSKAAASFLIFEPWWYIRTMVVADSRLNWLDQELKRQTYIYEGNWKRVIQLELTAFLIFFFGNLGMRFLGLLEFLKLSRLFFSNYFNQIFLTMIIVSLALPLLFLQKGVASNTSQFLQYFILLFGILAGISTARVIQKFKILTLQIIFSIFIILLAFPTQIGLIKDFYDSPPLSKISRDELTALEFLKVNSDKNSVILTPPYNGYLNLESNIPDIWDWFDTAYVSALSSRRTYLSDSEQVDIMGYDLKSRLKIQQDIFEETNPKEFSNKVKLTNANYLYFPLPQTPKVDLNKTTLNKIFANEIVEIWIIP